MTEPVTPDYYTVDEVAALLRVSARSVQRWIEAGELEVVRLGRTVRIPARALDTTREKESGDGRDD